MSSLVMSGRAVMSLAVVSFVIQLRATFKVLNAKRKKGHVSPPKTMTAKVMAKSSPISLLAYSHHGPPIVSCMPLHCLIDCCKIHPRLTSPMIMMIHECLHWHGLYGHINEYNLLCTMFSSYMFIYMRLTYTLDDLFVTISVFSKINHITRTYI